MRIVKIGVACVIGITCAMLLIELFLPSEPAKQTWPDKLLLQRQAILEQIDEDSWREKAAQAGLDEAKLEANAHLAIKTEDYLEAYKNASLIQPGAARKKILFQIFNSALEKCKNLGWSLGALELMDKHDREALEPQLLRRYEECETNPAE